MIKKIIFIHLFYASLNVLLACCNCSEEPSGYIEINKARTEIILSSNSDVKGVAFRLILEDSSQKNYLLPQSATLYSSAKAMSRCDCISRKILKEKIESIKIFTVNDLSNENKKDTDVSKLFVSDKIEQVFGSNVLKNTLTESIQNFNKQEFINDDYIPVFDLYLTLNDPILPAQFWIEVNLHGGRKMNILSPEFK